MGKSQKKKSMRRHNPMRVPDSHLPTGLAAASASSKKNETILPILQKMESPEVGDRKWACVAVSNLIQNDPSTRRLLQGKNVVGALITRLSDSEEEVIIEAAGALRNLCIDGGYDICAEMYNKNILASLRVFVPKISATLSQYLASPKSAPENAKEVIYEFSDSVITILWCLSETSNKALNAINGLGLVPFLMSFLAARDKLSPSTVTSAAQCLYVLTDENMPAISEVRSDSSYISCLLAIAKEGAIDLKGKGREINAERLVTQQVLSCGILRNISPIPPPSAAATIDMDRDVVLPTLQPVLSAISLADITRAVEEQLSKQSTDPPIEKLSLKNSPKTDHRTPQEVELARLENQLRAVQLALEVLTGMCATLPDPEAANPDDDADSDVDMADDAAMDPGAAPPVAPQSSTFLPTLVQPLLSLVHSTPLSFPSPPSTHPPTTSALAAIHISALECLNNIFFSLATTHSEGALSTDAEGGQRVWNELWRALGDAGLSVGTPATQDPARRKEFWEIAVGVLWGVGMIWKGNLVPDEGQVKVLMQVCDTAESETVRVKCIGVLECMAQHPESVEANRIIADYLVVFLPTAENTPNTANVANTEIILQAASALIDIYSDETAPYDVNFRQGGFLERMAGSINGVKRAVRGIDRKKEGGRELRLRGEEVRDNLVAFVDYRRGLGV